jgi:hypothetical protein
MRTVLPMQAGPELAGPRKNGSIAPVEISLGSLDLEGEFTVIGSMRDMHAPAFEGLRRASNVVQEGASLPPSRCTPCGAMLNCLAEKCGVCLTAAP